MRYTFGIMAVAVLLVTGCATGRNYQPEMDNLSTQVASLQKQLQAKNKEIGALQDEVRSLKKQLDAANQARRDAEVRLDAALNKLSKRGGTSGSGDYVK